MSSDNPYAAPKIEQVATETSAELTKATRGKRLLAAITDGFISMGFLLPGYIVLFTMSSEDGPSVLGLLLILAGFIALLVVQLRLLAANGWTLGKRYFNIRIVRSSGEKVSLGRLIGLRFLVPGFIGAIPLAGPLFSLANVLWIFGKEVRCLHDLIADTIVIDA